MHNSGSRPYFKSESHQMKLALSFCSQILLVFLPGRERKPFHTLTLIQNSKNSSSYLLKGKAVQGPDIEDDGGSIPQPPPPNFIVVSSPISGGLLMDFVLFGGVYRTMGRQLMVTRSKLPA